jgi:hypothetical protein
VLGVFKKAVVVVEPRLEVESVIVPEPDMLDEVPIRGRVPLLG